MVKLSNEQFDLLGGDWSEKIGEFIIAFSAIEKATLAWLIYLEPENDLLNDLLQQHFQARVEYICRTIDKNPALDIQEKESIRNTWAVAIFLSSLRNRLALRPLLLERPITATEATPPELLNTPALSDLLDGMVEQTQLLNSSDLEAATVRTIEVYLELESRLQNFL